ncbi:hypothetical protein NPIL_668331 [Nephila pilipes]|uniref:Uncharacterized protein n=1 Tax=Nephila pilipes TaxID=299642 RepID=A0A8X6N4B7_NEPPI|nr:hypothetical protein NPIL_668331 [Nephila pilipes]
MEEPMDYGETRSIDPTYLETHLKQYHISSSLLPPQKVNSSSSSGSSSSSSGSSTSSSTSGSSSSQDSVSECEASTSAKMHHCILTLEQEEKAQFKATFQKVKKKLIKTGDMDMLRLVAAKRLYEENWQSDVVNICYNVLLKLGPGVTSKQLYLTCRDECLARVPQSVKDEMLYKIRHCYEQEDEVVFKRASK